MENLSVIEIGQKEANQLIFNYHYLGDKDFRQSFRYGIEVGNELLGCVIYGHISAPETVVGAFGLERTDQDGFFEITRLVLNPNFNGFNYGSMLISRSIKKLRVSTKVRAIITYADSRYHIGAVYQAANFKYYGLSSPKKDFVVNGKTQERGKTKGMNGVWVSRPQKHRYAMVFDKKLKILWKEQPYPKKNDFVFETPPKHTRTIVSVPRMFV
jgi:hypothetical protein